MQVASPQLSMHGSNILIDVVSALAVARITLRRVGGGSS